MATSFVVHAAGKGNPCDTTHLTTDPRRNCALCRLKIYKVRHFIKLLCNLTVSYIGSLYTRTKYFLLSIRNSWKRTPCMSCTMSMSAMFPWKQPACWWTECAKSEGSHSCADDVAVETKCLVLAVLSYYLAVKRVTRGGPRCLESLGKQIG